MYSLHERNHKFTDSFFTTILRKMETETKTEVEELSSQRLLIQKNV